MIIFMDILKDELPKISESEWEVMHVLWKDSPQTSHQIISQLSHKEWSPKTVKTLIHRLEKKGLLSHEKGRREHLYQPLFTKDLYVTKESRSFVKKLFDGATAPMIAHFIENQKLSQDELEEIKKLINSMEENKNGR